MNLSILIPSRNNLEYLKLAYSSIRRNQGNHFVEILVLDDYSNEDNTWEWCEDIMNFDLGFKAFQNSSEKRLGISSGYKFLSRHATQEIICHWHADMVMTPGTLDAIERHLFSSGIFEGHYKNVVCLTRIEPPIYNKPGIYPEKIIWEDAPIEADDWNDAHFTVHLPHLVRLWGGKTTEGHFAPFFMFREDYLRLGGNDTENFPIQAREDSDWAFRLILAGFKTIQIPHFVYHFASRGNRRSKYGSGHWQDNPEWQDIERNSVRNFIRKWQTMRLHDEFLKPISPIRYNIGFVVKNCNWNLLMTLEPWCDSFRCDIEPELLYRYIEFEQPRTKIDLTKKLKSDPNPLPEIIVEIDGRTFNQSDMTTIEFLSDIITDSGEPGEFQLGNLRINIKEMNHYEQNLIVCKN